ncbi:MAG: phosphatidylserine/phosphatidylglycerophosphate/cardiolipin synthase family protein [Oligoflexus sp.]|nr:phosphatidylserine/phosphatidylglycerophosphate/cardiolipin synthase family protein [Oligoflexus sp.]
MYRLIAFFLLLSACRTTDSELKANRPDICANASLLERITAVVAPNQLSSSSSRCLQEQFQANLDLERRTTKDKNPLDRFDAREVAKNSSSVEPYALTKGNIVDRKVYVRGPEIFSKMRALISSAQEEVLIQTFVWESVSDSAQKVLEGLKDLEKRREADCPTCSPVVVRILANHGPTALDFISRAIGIDRPNDSGADARAGVLALKLNPQFVDVKVLTYTHQALGLTHAKSMVIDGQIAMITGANIQRFNDKDVNWNDRGYVVGGEIAKTVRMDLINNFIRADQGTERDGRADLAEKIGTPYERKFLTVYSVEKNMTQAYKSENGIPIIFTSRNGEGLPTTSNNNTQNRAFQTLFQNARASIDIQTPNFNDDAVVRGLGTAIKRQVKVELLLSKLFNCRGENQVGQGGQNAKAVNRLLREADLSAPKGPHHDFRWFSKLEGAAVKVVLDNPKGKLPEDRLNNSHAKFMVVDDEVVAVGAANMDTQSWNQSREINILIFDPEIAKAWKSQVFDESFQMAIPLTSEELVDSAIVCP